MPKKPTSHIPLHVLQAGQTGDFFALLAEKSKNATRDGKPFYTCRFRDKHRSVTFMVWSDGGRYDACEKEWSEGQFFKIRGLYQEHKQYGAQIDIYNIRPVNEEDEAAGFDPFDFVECSRFDPEEMFAELVQLADGKIENEPLRTLVLSILETNKEPLKRLPATKKHFHPFHGGLLEHILSVTRNCLFLAEKYRSHYPELKPPVNVDLIVAAAILHDIGRLAEFEDTIGAVEATVSGRLLGHIFLGRDLVRDAAPQIDDLDPELLQLLEHLIVTHLNLPAWGSPRLPLIPEALILHHADDLDAKMEMYARCLMTDEEEGAFTARDPVLNRKLFKGRKV